MMQKAIEILKERRTVRRYDHSRELSDELLMELVDVARMAPNTGNMQLYSAIVTSDKARLAEVARIGHFNQPAAAGAQAIVTFCIDMERFGRWCEMSGTSSSLGNLQGLTWATIDTTIFAQQFVTAAELSGLGTCYLGTTTYCADKLADYFGLPSGIVPLIAVSVGWPAEEGDSKDRLPLEVIVAKERYRALTDEALQQSYEATEQQNHRFTEENGKERLAQVFTEVRYPQEQAEAFSEVYGKLLREAGFSVGCGCE